jgi:hypothetical protein
MPLKPGARVLTLDGASAVVKEETDDSLTQLKSNSLYMLRELGNYQGGAATVQKIGPDYTEAIGAGATNDAPAVAAGATSDKEPSIDKANMALGSEANAIYAIDAIADDAIVENTMGIGTPHRQQEQVVDDRPAPVSAFR